MKIRGPINPTPEEVIWSALERHSLTDKEKQILELSGYTFYERHQIPRQLLELYTLCLTKNIEKVLDIVYLFQPGQEKGASGDLRVIVPDYTKPKPHTGECVDCIACCSNIPLFYDDPFTCKCGSRNHCPNSRQCILWKNDKDIDITIQRVPLQTPEKIEYNPNMLNIENLHDNKCLSGIIRYTNLISCLAATCPCGDSTCIFRRLAGTDICKNLGFDDPKHTPKEEKGLPLVCNTDTPGLLETTSIPPFNTWKKITSLPEGRYTCKKFAVSKLGNKTIVILLLGDVPVYSYRIQEAIKI